MKILHFDFDDLESPSAGGQAVRTFEINRRLAKLGHQITVITLDYENAQTKTKEGVHYERIGIKKFPWNYISYFLSIRSALKKHDYDLVVEDNIAPLTFGFSPLFTRKPVISQTQCFFAEESSRKHHLPFWIFQKYGARFYKNFIVLTKSMAQKIQKLSPKARIEIIPNGLNEVAQTSQYLAHSPHHPSHPQKPYFLFLGRIAFYHKGLDFLLKSMKWLQIKNPDIQVIVAGEGEDKEKFLQIIKDENLKNVIYKGKVQGQQKEDLLKNCLALVQPSRFEIFPFTILEAAAHGKPTIAFKIENLDEIVKDRGILVPAFNESAFGEAMLALATNENLRNDLDQKAHAWAKNHLWDKIAKQQETFYLDVLARAQSKN